MQALARKSAKDESAVKRSATRTPDLSERSPSRRLSPTLFIQRQTVCPCDGGCPRCAPVVQAKLKIGQPNDKYEQEADRIAEQVMSMPEPDIRKSPDLPSMDFRSRGDVGLDEETVQSKPIAEQITPLVQRQTELEEEDEEEGTLGQAKSFDQQPAKINGGTELQSISIPESGRPLSERARAYFEPRFGVDFEDVRIHTGGRAAGLARSVNARAFTHGKYIFFGAGQYAPDSRAGRRLLAHELTHVVQQRNGTGIMCKTTGQDSFGEGFSEERHRAEAHTYAISDYQEAGELTDVPFEKTSGVASIWIATIRDLLPDMVVREFVVPMGLLTEEFENEIFNGFVGSFGLDFTKLNQDQVDAVVILFRRSNWVTIYGSLRKARIAHGLDIKIRAVYYDPGPPKEPKLIFQIIPSISEYQELSLSPEWQYKEQVRKAIKVVTTDDGHKIPIPAKWAVYTTYKYSNIKCKGNWPKYEIDIKFMDEENVNEVQENLKDWGIDIAVHTIVELGLEGISGKYAPTILMVLINILKSRTIYDVSDATVKYGNGMVVTYYVEFVNLKVFEELPKVY
jgi:hypothetical protein